MYAIGENLETCAEPKECCQPVTDVVVYGGIEIGFCDRHSVKRWLEQDAESSGDT